MVKAGLSDDVIVATINISAGPYDTTANGLIALKLAGVSDKVIAAVVAKNAAPTPAPSPTPSRNDGTPIAALNSTSTEDTGPLRKVP
jgi:hypothetical protein